MSGSSKQVVILRPLNDENGCIVIDPEQLRKPVGIPAGTYTILRGLATAQLPSRWWCARERSRLNSGSASASN